jgi:NhaP-type Na+/H+ or K+/H+ antiporter
MNKTTPSLILSSLLAATIGFPLLAQIAPTTTTAPTKEEAVLLTPFEVTSAKDTG